MTVTINRPRALAESLLPESTGGRAWAGYLFSFAGAMAFLLLIPAGWAGARLDHLWAEDGARWMVDAIRTPTLENLVTPYGGYLHTLPRLVAEVIALFPLEWTAALFAVSAAALRVMVAFISFAASGAYLRSTPLRFALAALVVVLPAGACREANGGAVLSSHRLLTSPTLDSSRSQHHR